MEFIKIIIHKINKLIIFFPLFFIAACGGGGGGGGGASISNGAGATEFLANYGLTNIGAARAFNLGSTGSGITIALVDTGIDLTHPEFTGRISPNSTNIFSPGSSVQDVIGHGTGVAGIIAANRDLSGVVGVAQSATILALLTVNNGGTFSDDDIATAIDTAVVQGARVVNLSLGDDTIRPNANLQSSMQNAVNSGVIIVNAAGNSFLSDSAFQARMSACAGESNITCNGFNAQGLMLAVMSTDQNDQRSTFSNSCGTAANACLGAPGTDIVTTAIGGGFQTPSGTSLSAPHVSGALALILQTFPTLSASQAVSLLLATATDLGDSGVDNIFGNGLLNIAAAFQNQGFSVIPTGSTIRSSSVPASNTSLRLGSSFGNALKNNSFLKEAIILDSFERPFKVDLGNTISREPKLSNLSNFIHKNRITQFKNYLSFNTSINFSIENKKYENIEKNYSLFKSNYSNKVNSFSLSSKINKNLILKFVSEIPSEAVFKENIIPESLFAVNQVFYPQFAFSQHNNGAAFNLDINSKTNFTYAFLNSNKITNGIDNNTNLHQTFFSYSPSKKTQVKLGFGLLEEDASVLASRSSGVFGKLENSKSNFISLATKTKINKNWDFFGSYAEIITNEPDNSGFFSNWGKIRANAISTGLSSSNIFFKDDKMAFSFYQPMRVYNARANLTLPINTEPRPDGKIIYKTKRLSVAPTGRELSFQAAYSWKKKYIKSSTYGLLSVNPNHDDKAKNTFTIGVKTEINF